MSRFLGWVVERGGAEKWQRFLRRREGGVVQDVLARFKEKHPGDWDLLPEKAVFQMNDTHPTCAVTELMRLLIDEEGLSWEKAWDLTKKVPLPSPPLPFPSSSLSCLFRSSSLAPLQVFLSLRFACFFCSQAFLPSLIRILAGKTGGLGGTHRSPCALVAVSRALPPPPACLGLVFPLPDRSAELGIGSAPLFPLHRHGPRQG